jgi:DNA-binding beta-propeller fold protein YncE
MRTKLGAGVLGIVLGCACGPALGAEKLVLVAGGGKSPADGLATRVQLQSPFGVAFDRGGNLFLVEMTGHRVRKIDPRGRLTTVAGTGQKGYGGDGGPAKKARFNSMHSLAVAANGDVFLADTWNNRVRKIDAKTGTITTVAGTGQKGFGGDGGPATKARFGGIYCVALDPAGKHLYLADLDNRRIRTVDLTTGIVTTVAGNGKRGRPKDGAEARQSPLIDPRAVAVDARGKIYILERSGYALRVVGPAGKIRTVVGTGKQGNSGDGGDARRATLNGPKHLCLDRAGNVLIADTENHVIRRYLPRTGKIVRVAGTGAKGRAGLGGPPLQAELFQPHGVYVHTDGTVYIADSSNHRVLKIAG